MMTMTTAAATKATTATETSTARGGDSDGMNFIGRQRVDRPTSTKTKTAITTMDHWLDIENEDDEDD